MLISGMACLFAIRPPHVVTPELPLPVREVTDMAGRSVLLSGEPRSVMVFSPNLWDYVTVDGGDQHIAAISSYLKHEANTTMLGAVFPDLRWKNLAMARGAVPLGVEQVLTMQPDLVVCQSWNANALAQIRYPGLVQIKVDGSAGRHTTYRLFGLLTDRQDAVDALFDRYELEMAEFRQGISTASPHSKVALMGAPDAAFRIRNVDMRRIIEWLGARDVFDHLPEHNGPINIEMLILLDPDFIFLPSYKGDSRLTPVDLYDDPRLAPIAAVKQHRVYRMPGGVARMGGPIEDPLLAQWMAELMNPAMRPRRPLRMAIREAYRTAYAYEASDEDIDMMLRLDDNRNSAGYRRFASHSTASSAAPEGRNSSIDSIHLR